MPKKTVTVRQSMTADVSFQVSFINERKERQVKMVLEVWSSITGLAFAKMPQTDLSGDVCPANEGFLGVQVEHPLDSRGPVTLFWEA